MLSVEIRVKGHIDATWSTRFSGLAVSHAQNGDTVLTGHLPDQPALRGVLSWLADLGLELVSATAQPVGCARE